MRETRVQAPLKSDDDPRHVDMQLTGLLERVKQLPVVNTAVAHAAGRLAVDVLGDERPSTSLIGTGPAARLNAAQV